MIAAAKHLNISLPAMVGHMTFLWDWVGEYATDGILGKFTPQQIAAAALWPEETAKDFVEILIKVKFFDKIPKKDGSLRIHDWLDHCEQFVIKRLQRQGIDAPRRPDGVRTASGQHPDGVQPTQPSPAQ